MVRRTSARAVLARAPSQVVLSFNQPAAAMATHLVGRLPLRTMVHAGHRVLGAIRRYASYPGPLVNVLICSMAVQGLRIVQAYYLGRGLGIDAAVDAYIAFVPIILLVMLLPVTFNGIGTSQWAFYWFFSRVGVPVASGFALSVLFVALGIVGNLPGGVLYAWGRKES